MRGNGWQRKRGMARNDDIMKEKVIKQVQEGKKEIEAVKGVLWEERESTWSGQQQTWGS